MITGLFRNWRFRDAKPAFAPGEEIRAYLTGFDASSGKGMARIGDTVLKVSGADADQVDRLVTLRVADFDSAHGVGHAVITASPSRFESSD